MSMVRVLAFAFSVSLARAAEPRAIELWPEGVPGLRADAGPEREENGRFLNIHRPSLLVYPPSPGGGSGAGTAVIYAPGGGYVRVAAGAGGGEITRWLNQLGVTVFLLKYRNAEYGHPAPLRDALRAVRIVRSRAGEFGLDPRRIALLGFSAGGQVALVAATRNPPEKPDCVLLVYPWKIVGEKNVGLRSDVAIDASAPPMFIAQAANDTGSVPQGSLNLYAALLTAKVPAEIHIYEGGGHGFGLQKRENAPGTSDWPNRAVDWLRTRGW